MAQIVALHGVVSDDDTQTQLSQQWYPALVDGLASAGYEGDFSFQLGFYGDLIHPEGPDDLSPSWGWDDVKLGASALYNALSESDLTHWRCGRSLFRHLMQCPTLQGLSDKLMRQFLTQVWRYFHQPGLREQIHQRLLPLLQADTRVLVAHSLGSVVAYEMLCQHSFYRVDTLITLGSPLGMSGLVFERLQPSPLAGIGQAPPVRHWINLFDREDLVAFSRRLAPLFDQAMDIEIENGWFAHMGTRYLRAQATGLAVAQALRRAGA